MIQESAHRAKEAPARSPGDLALMEEYVKRWQRLGPLLEAQREEDARRAEIVGSYSFFAGMVLKHLEDFHPLPTSGLIEQQAWFRKLHPTSH